MFSSDMDQPPVMPPTPAQQPVKKGIPVIGWVGIGCSGLLLLAIIGMVVVFTMFAGFFKDFMDNPEKAAAELIVSSNPDLQKVSQDDAKGEMTIRTKEGKEVTLSYKDLVEGKISITDEDGGTTHIGSADLSKVPEWVPMATDLSDGISTYQSDNSEKVEGQFSGKSDQSLAELRTFFEGEASQLGMQANSNSSVNADGTSILTLHFSGENKTLTFIISENVGEKTLVNTNFSEKK